MVSSRWKKSESERFWDHVEKTPECWLWTASKKGGYGVFWVWDPATKTDTMVMAHRYAYGEIPDGMTLDHLCHTRSTATCHDGPDCPHRSCVRPAHMEPVPLRENIQRGGNAAKTHCKRGHEFTPENTWLFTNASGGQGRKCKACVKVLDALRWQRTKAARATSRES